MQHASTVSNSLIKAERERWIEHCHVFGVNSEDVSLGVATIQTIFVSGRPQSRGCLFKQVTTRMDRSRQDTPRPSKQRAQVCGVGGRGESGDPAQRQRRKGCECGAVRRRKNTHALDSTQALVKMAACTLRFLRLVVKVQVSTDPCRRRRCWQEWRDGGGGICKAPVDKNRT